MNSLAKVNTGLLPPQDIEIEQAVLGAIMLEKSAITMVGAYLHGKIFYKDQHRVIYEAIQVLNSKSEPIDILTVTNELRRVKQLEMAGGALYITDLTSKVSSSANLEIWARILQELYIKRESISAAMEMQKMGFNPETDPFELIDFFTKFNLKILTQIDNGKTRFFKGVLMERIQHIGKMMEQKSTLTGVDTGFLSINNFTGGWQSPDLIIIAARPAMGKTSLALNFLLGAAKAGIPSAIFSLEMSESQLTDRIIAQETHVSSAKNIGRGKISEHEYNAIIHKSGQLLKYNIHMDDTAGLSISQFKGKAYKLKQQYDIGLIVIDYLQLMSGEGKGNREQEIAQISRGLKKVAKELNIPIIALSQLSRSVETRGGDKRPQLSDLRESGAIEQDADIVIFLHRPEYYGITEIDGQSMLGKAEVIFAKHRNGGTDTILLDFIGKYTDFKDPKFEEIPSTNEFTYGNNFRKIDPAF